MTFLRRLGRLPLYLIALPALLAFRLLRPWLLVRWAGVASNRIGPFAAITELYFCERDAGINVPNRRHVDVFYFKATPIANAQLARMWRRRLRVWPQWFLGPVDRLNRAAPGGHPHEIGANTRGDRDVHNLLDWLPPHLEFTPEERETGNAGLRAIGIPRDARFVCLHVRDSAYLAAQLPSDWSYHNYRDSDIRNYVLAVEELADRGYFVVRMGAKVERPLESSNRRVIDYAANGMRSDFMDIFLGASCHFAISTGSGWDAIPYIFRRPIVYVNYVPLGYLITFRARDLNLSRPYWSTADQRKLTLTETLERGVAFFLRSSEYEGRGVSPIENTPEEIRDAVIEMEERLSGRWHGAPGDDELQERFRQLFAGAVGETHQGRSLHGELSARYSAAFLRRNPWWLA